MIGFNKQILQCIENILENAIILALSVLCVLATLNVVLRGTVFNTNSWNSEATLHASQTKSISLNSAVYTAPVTYYADEDEVIAPPYYDPNEIDEPVIISLSSIPTNTQPTEASNKLFEKSGLTAAQLNEVIKTFCLNSNRDPSGFLLNQCGQALIEMEETYSINALYVIAMARVESGLKSSQLAVKYNNPLSVYTKSGKLKSYSTISEAINGIGKLLKESYYDKRNCRNIYEVGKIYCETSGWADKVYSYVYSLISISKNL